MAQTIPHSAELKRRNLCTACILLVVSLCFAGSVIYVRYGRAPLLPPSNPSWQAMAQPADAAIAAPSPMMPIPQQQKAASHGQDQ
jgi:hypothetical protein